MVFVEFAASSGGLTGELRKLVLETSAEVAAVFYKHVDDISGRKRWHHLEGEGDGSGCILQGDELVLLHLGVVMSHHLGPA